MEQEQDWLWELIMNDKLIEDKELRDQSNLPNGKSLNKGERP